MSFHSDERMFAEQDARSDGYRDGSAQAKSVMTWEFAGLLGVDVDLLKGIDFSDVNVRVVTLTAVASAVEGRLEKEHDRLTRYTSPDPKVVSGIILEEQHDLSKVDEEGFSDLNYYQFEVEEGNPVVLTRPYHYGYIQSAPVTGEWVLGRLAQVGVEQDAIVGGQIAQELQNRIVGGVVNG